MPAEHRPGFTPHVVVGLSIMLLGLVLMLDRLGLVEARAVLQLWPVLLIIFGASVVMQALRGEPVQSDASLARDRSSDIVGLVALLVVAFLLVSHLEARREVRAAPAGMHTASVFTVMGREEQTAPAQPFHGGEITTIMGRSHLDLREVVVTPGSDIVVEVLGLMGRVVIMVPADWSVDVQTTPLMAAVRTRRARADVPDRPPSLPPDVLERPDPPAGVPAPPRLVLRGVVLMGALTVQ